jgi:hypothetical protein
MYGVSFDEVALKSFMQTHLCNAFGLLCLVSVAFGGGGCGALLKNASLSPAAREPSQLEPVTAAMGVDRPSVRAGDLFELVVHVRIASGYHIYGMGKAIGPFSATALNVDLPKDMEAVGGWIFPQPVVTRGGETIYRDSIVFRRRVKVRLNVPEKMVSIKGELLCQACEEDLCRPPGRSALSASVAVVSK